MASVIGLDDTDSREVGMCTTYVGTRLADAFEAEGATVLRRVLVRLNPGIEHKTRGNAAVALTVDLPPERAMAIATPLVDDLAVTEDPNTNPGLVAVNADEAASLVDVTWRGIRDIIPLATVRTRLASLEASQWTAGTGRGLVGATAAIGAVRALDDWTHEYLAYRQPSRWGTPRDVDPESVIEAAEATYPLTWDTIDTATGDILCTPNTPGPVLFGIRGDTRSAVRETASMIDHEPVERIGQFVTNQGTDQHLQYATPGATRDGRSYRVTGQVSTPPTTGQGGHVRLAIAAGDGSLECVAFEPTKRFRDHVRSLIVGDVVTVCGERAAGTLKLEKFALRRLRRYERVVPTCRSCGARMESAGRNQGYRCRECDTSRPAKVIRPRERSITPGWYEVPPVARRHIAKPLVRGGFDDVTHPSR